MRYVAIALLLVAPLGCTPDDPTDPGSIGPPAPTVYPAPVGSETERRLHGTCIPFELDTGRTVCVMSTPQNGTPGELSPGATRATDAGPGSSSSALLDGIPEADSLPASIDHRSQYLDECISVSDQQHCGWCAVHAATGLLEALHCSKGCDVPELSEAHLRSQSRGGVPFEGCAEGWSTTDALRVMSEAGIADNTTWPYVGSGRGLNATRPDDATLRMAAVHKATGYHTIGTSDLTTIKRILASEREVLIAVPVYRSPGWQGGSAVAVPTPARPCSCGGSCSDAECLRGYHAIVLTGYDDATMEFTFLNSWGKDWGDGGYGRMTYDFVQTHGHGGGYLQDVDTSVAGNACDDAPSPCADNGDCAACTAVSGCGWCGDSGGSCRAGGGSAPAEGSCSDWRPVRCDAAADPCSVNRDCASCAAAAGCAWCGGSSGGCFSLLGRTEFCSDPRSTAEECGDCDGSDCVSCAGASACGWCDGGCVVGGPLGAERSDCGDYSHEASMCDDFDRCPVLDGDCAACTDTSGCGYCQDTRTCSQGGFWGPSDGSCGDDWDYFTFACEDPPPPSCADNASCGGCASTSGCGWCMDTGNCQDEGACAAQVVDPAACSTCSDVGTTCIPPATMGAAGSCCDGLSCIVDRCENCAGLLGVSEACGSSADCCGQMICSGIADASDLRCCLRDTDPCDFSTDCCGGMRCVGGRCECQPVGQPCLTGRECCGAAFCDAGVCSSG